MLRSIEQGYVQREIENAAYEFQKKVESGEQKIVGELQRAIAAKAVPNKSQGCPVALLLDPVEGLLMLRPAKDHALVVRDAAGGQIGIEQVHPGASSGRGQEPGKHHHLVGCGNAIRNTKSAAYSPLWDADTAAGLDT